MTQKKLKKIIRQETNNLKNNNMINRYVLTSAILAYLLTIERSIVKDLNINSIVNAVWLEDNLTCSQRIDRIINDYLLKSDISAKDLRYFKYRMNLLIDTEKRHIEDTQKIVKYDMLGVNWEYVALSDCCQDCAQAAKDNNYQQIPLHPNCKCYVRRCKK